jgi:hypothetical protein
MDKENPNPNLFGIKGFVVVVMYNENTLNQKKINLKK